MKLISLILCGGIVVSISCTPAEQAEATKIENVVLLDLASGLAAGKSDVQIIDQIDTDVGKLVAGQAGVDVALIVNEALQFLIDTGEIPANELPTAKAMTVKLKIMLATKATLSVPTTAPMIVPVPAAIVAKPVATVTAPASAVH